MALRVLPIFSAILLTAILPHAHSQGLTLDQCGPNTECTPPRECRDIVREQECLIRTSSCRCIPPREVTCLSDDLCEDGEVCAALRLADGSGTTPFFCVSETVVDSNPALTKATPSNTKRGGLTRDSCRFNSDCLSPRICVLESNTAPPGACIGSFGCNCVPPTFTACDANNDCPEGEVCGYRSQDICVSRKVTSGNVEDFPNPTQVADPENVQDILNGKAEDTPRPTDDTSRPTDDTPRPTDNTPRPTGLPQTGSPTDAPGEPEVVVITREVCVAERHMKGVKGVYERGRYARVLCDAQGSCATPGHVVVYDGKGMMMRRYCEVVGCVERVMKVNSPAWERGLRLESWSEGLEFSAFAARYETLAEEVFLRGLVRAGL